MLDVLHWLIAGCGVLVFGLFTWAVRYHFVSAAMPLAMKLVSVLAATALGIGLLLLPASAPGLWRSLLCLAGMSAALALFMAALRVTRGRALALAFDPVAPRETLVTEGPYAWVRHPIYLSYAMFWLAWLIAVPKLPLALPVFLLLTLYLVAARREEDRLLASDQGETYRRYAERTGLLPAKLFAMRGRK